ncbi:hypothetical protein [Oleomonas cavernae]|uniref:hypothetical protein n=1 Tax=Oleomonas cavernae TaxID=2320859 RepID=UPI0011C43889|nr:hypothetical protein [Oleomonas cavernae]
MRSIARHLFDSAIFGLLFAVLPTIGFLVAVYLFAGGHPHWSTPLKAFVPCFLAGLFCWFAFASPVNQPWQRSLIIGAAAAIATPAIFLWLTWLLTPADAHHGILYEVLFVARDVSRALPFLALIAFGCSFLVRRKQALSEISREIFPFSLTVLLRNAVIYGLLLGLSLGLTANIFDDYFVIHNTNQESVWISLLTMPAVVWLGVFWNEPGPGIQKALLAAFMAAVMIHVLAILLHSLRYPWEHAFPHTHIPGEILFWVGFNFKETALVMLPVTAIVTIVYSLFVRWRNQLTAESAHDSIRP